MKLMAVVCLASAVALGCSDDDDNQQQPADSSVPDVAAAADITVTGSCLPKGTAINCYPSSSGGKAVAWTATGNKKVIGTRWACEFSKSAGGKTDWFYHGGYVPPNCDDCTGVNPNKWTLEQAVGGVLCSKFTGCPQPVGIVSCSSPSGKIRGSQKSPVIHWEATDCKGVWMVTASDSPSLPKAGISFERAGCTDPAGKKL